MANPVNKAQQTSAPKAGKGPMIMGLCRTLSFSASVLALVVLFSGVYDLGFIDLTQHIGKFSAPLIFLLILSIAAGAHAGSRVTAFQTSIGEKKFAATKEAIDQRIGQLEKKVDGFFSEEISRIKAENDNFRKFIEDQRDEEKKRALEEAEALKSVNRELQEKINRWAIDSIDGTMNGENVKQLSV